MIFPFKEAPEWFCHWIKQIHLDNLCKLAPADHSNLTEGWIQTKKNCAAYFNRNGINSWYNIDDDQIWFKIKEDDPEWIFPMLRS